MKNVVVYASKSGFVKNYANWIAQELNADIFDSKQTNIDTLLDYETIIYGGGLYAVGINGIRVITKNFNAIKDKNIIIFASGATPYRNGIIDGIINNNFNEEQRNHIKFFYMRGGFNYHKLHFFDKLLMNLLKLKIRSKKKLTPDERGMLAAYDTPVDFTRKKNIAELITYVKNIG